MDLQENDTILYLWAGLIPESAGYSRPGDWLCLMVARGDSKQLEAEYRFRWHNSAGFETPDEKSFYRIGPGPDSPEARIKLRDAMRGVAQFFENVQERQVDGNWHTLMGVLDSLEGMRFLHTFGTAQS